MRLASFSFLAALPVLAASAPAEAPLAAWAGPEAGALGLTQERMLRYVEARGKDRQAGASAEWRPWLEGLLKAKKVSVKVWAMARLLEAGFSEQGPGWIEAVHYHFRAVSEFRSGYYDRLLVPPPALQGADLPSPWVLHPDTPFLRTCFEELKAAPQKYLTEERYDALAYNLRPVHRDTLLAITPACEAPPAMNMWKIKAKSDQVSRDPYKDRVWRLVNDWLVAWGSTADFDAFRAALPRTLIIQKESQLLEDDLRDIPRFWGAVAWADDHKGEDRFGPPPPEPAVLANRAAIPVTPDRAKEKGIGCEIQLRVGFQGAEILHVRPLPSPWLCLFGPPVLRAANAWTISSGGAGDTEVEILETMAMGVN